MVRRRSKSRRLRGRTRTMGWGRIGQHRKSGSRGGKGAAGLGKHGWTWVIKYAPTWFGKRGFNPPRIRAGYKRLRTVINVSDLEEIARSMPKEGGEVVVDLRSMGIHKLLGEGKIRIPVKVIVPEASERAKKKVEEAGGTVIVSR